MCPLCCGPQELPPVLSFILLESLGSAFLISTCLPLRLTKCSETHPMFQSVKIINYITYSHLSLEWVTIYTKKTNK
uniref:Uncharacterized protein n=1 Tax=Panstrongylus lignarius TaxID=156445 RepID=A0A224XTF5_9HEMI